MKKEKICSNADITNTSSTSSLQKDYLLAVYIECMNKRNCKQNSCLTKKNKKKIDQPKTKMQLEEI